MIAKDLAIAKIQHLPNELVQEVSDFIAFLTIKQDVRIQVRMGIRDRLSGSIKA
jgi:hypothetical protein